MKTDETIFNRLRKKLGLNLSLIIVIVASIVLEGGGLLQYFYFKREASDPRAGQIFLILLVIGLIMVILLIIRAVTNMKKIQNISIRNERMESELHIAREIQMAMIPKTFPPFPDRNDLDFAASIVPAKEVGGDLYDFFIRDEKLYFCIGDVSGKGVPASLVMAVTRSLFRAMSARESGPQRIVSSMNDTMSESNESNMFVTFFCGVLNLATGQLRYCNAGHNPPLLLSDDIHLLDVQTNIPLGVVYGYKYDEQEIQLRFDDSLLLYTDGLTEAENRQAQQFGLDRVKTALQIRGSSQEHLDRLLASVNEFVGDAPQSDDLTMLFIRFLSQGDAQQERHLLLHNDIQQIPQLADFVETIAREKQLSQSLAMGINLALEEAVSNVILYAYPKETDGLVDVEAYLRKDSLEFLVVDSGVPFDPTAAPLTDISLSAENRSIGGLGIHLVRELMDTVSYERKDEKNYLRMIKKI